MRLFKRIPTIVVHPPGKKLGGKHNVKVGMRKPKAQLHSEKGKYKSWYEATCSVCRDPVRSNLSSGRILICSRGHRFRSDGW